MVKMINYGLLFKIYAFDDINKSVLLSLFTALKKAEFKFLEDLGVYNQDNESDTKEKINLFFNLFRRNKNIIQSKMNHDDIYKSKNYIETN